MPPAFQYAWTSTASCGQIMATSVEHGPAAEDRRQTAISPAAYLPASSTSRRAGASSQKCSVRLLISARNRFMKMPRQPKKIASRR